MSWSTVEAGRTVGEVGPQSGRVLRDEQHARGARITLEEGASQAGYVITCAIAPAGIEHVFATDASGTAARVFNAMKSDLDRILPLFAAHDRREQVQADVAMALDQFVRSYR